MNNSSLLPSCVDDLQIYHETFLGKKKYFMVSEKRQKYLRLNESQYEFFTILKSCFDGKHTAREFGEKINSFGKGDISVESAIETMYKHNLLKEQYEEIKPKVELELSSKKVCEIDLGQLQEKYALGLKALDVMINVLGVMAILFTLYLMIFNMPLIRIVIEGTGNFSWKNVSPKDFVFIAILSLLAVPIHEFGHLLAANRYNVRWKTFTFALKWGVNPVYYIKYYNFYTNTSKNKILILLSGVYYNLLQACVFFILLIAVGDWRFAVLSIINLGCIVSCMMPSGTSDGYHVMSLFLGIEGIRWKMLSLVSSIIKQPSTIVDVFKSKENVGLFIYFIVSYGIGIYGCYALMLTLLDYLHIFSADKLIISIVLVIWLVASVGTSIVKFGNNLKKL